MPDLAALKARYPQYGIVDAVDAIGGGTWALGADGGVFALDGAEFHGSYLTLDPAHRNDPNRKFVAIMKNEATGGYELKTDKGLIYGGETFGNKKFMAEQKANQGNVKTPDAGKPGVSAVDANQVTLRSTMERLGLGGLVDEAWKYWTSMGGTANMEAVNTWLRDQPKFQERFPALKRLEQKNVFWSPGEYLQYETNVRNQMAGLPPDFMEDADIAELAVNGWSVDEVGNAVTEAKTAALTMPPEARQALQDYYGIGAGELTAFWLDPDAKGKDLIERKAKATIAGIGGAVGKTAFGKIGADEAQQIFQTPGVTAQDAAGFLGNVTGFLSETAGESMAGEDLNRQTAIGALTTQGGADEAALKRRKEARAAQFSGGGGANTGSKGGTGLGSS